MLLHFHEKCVILGCSHHFFSIIYRFNVFNYSDLKYSAMLQILMCDLHSFAVTFDEKMKRTVKRFSPH